MPTVSDLHTFVMRASSLNTSDTAESALALSAMNDAYARALALSGSATYDASVSPAANSDVIHRAAYTPANTVGAGTVSVKAVYLNSGAGAASGRRLQRVGMGELLGHRTGSQVASGTGPIMYAVRSNGDIELYPNTVDSNALTVEMSLQPPTLVLAGTDPGTETTPSALPAFLHFEVICNYAISQMFVYRGLADKAGFFRSLYENGLEELRAFLNEQGGIMGPRVQLRRHASYGSRYPDQRY